VTINPDLAEYMATHKIPERFADDLAAAHEMQAQYLRDLSRLQATATEEEMLASPPEVEAILDSIFERCTHEEHVNMHRAMEHCDEGEVS
jgi:hypothetical protein